MLRSLLFFLSLGLSLALPPPPDGRIVGGEEAEPHSRPYQIALYIGTGVFKSFACGGSVYDEVRQSLVVVVESEPSQINTVPPHRPQ